MSEGMSKSTSPPFALRPPTRSDMERALALFALGSDLLQLLRSRGRSQQLPGVQHVLA